MSHIVLASIDGFESSQALMTAERVLERLGKVSRRLTNVFELQTSLQPSRVHAALRQELDSDVRICVSYSAVMCAS